MNALLLLPSFLAILPQDPARPSAQAAPSEASATVRLDVLELKNGDELVGRITAEIDGYVELEVEGGGTIGISRAMVAKVHKGAREAKRRAALVRGDDQWFVLHDADGRSVGWLHASVTPHADGRFTVNEEYEFQNGARRYQVTNQCTADADGRGLRSYYRERVSSPRAAGSRLPAGGAAASDDRIEDERIVEAIADGEELTVMHLDGRGRTERTLPWTASSTFPLLARTLARHATTVVGPAPMFDPKNEELVVRRIDGTGARQIVVDGQKERVGEIAETGVAGSNREWVDADLRTVRRELAGPALVAVPSSAASARAAVGVSSIDSAIVAEADGRFGLWVPNPAWVAVEPLPRGHLELECKAHGAEIRLSLIDHLEASTVLETAADAVGRWLGLLYPNLELDSRFDVEVRGRHAIRMIATDSRNRERATVDVIPHEGRFVVLICRGPINAWDELAPDFAFVRRTIELDRAGLNPRRQGPLSEDRGGRLRPPTGPVPAPTPAPRIEGEPDTKVRIPN